MHTKPAKSKLQQMSACACLVLLLASRAQAQTDWNQIHQQNWEHQQRIEAQNRQQQENQENYMRQQEQEQQNARDAQDARSQQNQDYSGNQQSYQAPQAGWVDSYLSMAMTARYAEAWVAMNFRNKADADAAVLAACQKQVGEAPCFIAMGITNGYVANSLADGGAVLADLGATAEEAKAKVAAQCEQASIGCTPMHVYASPGWRVNTTPADFERVISPVLTPELENHYAVVAWTTSDDVWAKSTWAASGHKTLEAAEAVAIDRCKQDAGDQCKRATFTSRGFIAIGQDDAGQLRTHVNHTAARAEQGLQTRCKKDQHSCTLIQVVDARSSGAKRIQLPRPWLGLTYNEVSAELAKQLGFEKPRGALITEVTKGGPAAKAGLQVGDVVLIYDGKPVNESSEFGGIIGQSKTGAPIKIELMHYGKRATITATLVEFGGTQ